LHGGGAEGAGAAAWVGDGVEAHGYFWVGRLVGWVGRLLMFGVVVVGGVVVVVGGGGELCCLRLVLWNDLFCFQDR
jgi:hypothetical protein